MLLTTQPLSNLSNSHHPQQNLPFFHYPIITAKMAYKKLICTDHHRVAPPPTDVSRPAAIPPDTASCTEMPASTSISTTIGLRKMARAVEPSCEASETKCRRHSKKEPNAGGPVVVPTPAATSSHSVEDRKRKAGE
ncbi:hypothetical protein BC936DRAFT_141460 [Jimgerdemannia flammicorona]|uniref:Uncharacterized protein n=1 Tax=Jimgerdemannia flammicorona TaxID=994334 RepID=A0A433DN35_9FUNG|nr:hypothetical protein BC936DRAFT_141460 [Jimgerdemannia flammicorona]